MLPVTIAASAPLLEIRLDIRRGGLNIQMAWPLSELAKLNTLLDELLR